MTSTAKICKKCGCKKELFEFYKHVTSSDGTRSDCKSCFKSKVKLYQQTNRGLISKIYGQQKSSSKKRKHTPPNYTLDQLQEWIFSQPNFEKLYNDWVNSDYDKYLIPSCDRLKDELPYTFDNLRLTTWGVNDKKGHAFSKKQIIGTHIKTGEIIEFYSISEAERNGFNQSNISACCIGTRNHHKNYRWKYK